MFRKYFKSNDDTGATADTADLPAAFNEVSGEQMILDAINSANADPDAASGDSNTDSASGGTDSPGAEGGETKEDTPSSQEELILNRFKTTDDLVKSYENLEPAYTQSQQQVRELERQLEEIRSQLSSEPEDDGFEFDTPFSDNPTNVQELEALAEASPDKAAIWAITNSARLPSELVQETVNYWHSRNPAQATAYMLQSMMQSMMPQIDQRIAPVTEQHQAGLVQQAVTLAETKIGPQYGQYHDRIIDTIEKFPSLMPSDVSNPQVISDAIVNVYAMLLGQDMLAKGQALVTSQGGAAPAPQAAQSVQTATRTMPAPTPVADGDEAAIHKMIQDSILNAH